MYADIVISNIFHLNKHFFFFFFFRYKARTCIVASTIPWTNEEFSLNLFASVRVSSMQIMPYFLFSIFDDKIINTFYILLKHFHFIRLGDSDLIRYYGRLLSDWMRAIAHDARLSSDWLLSI